MKPNRCPFCGSDKLEYFDDKWEGGEATIFWVSCEECFAGGPTGKNKRLAVVLWNAALRNLEGAGE